MAVRVGALILCLLAFKAQASEINHRANPIRKVVTMLQDMTKTVEEEGVKEEKAFKEFMCYCKTGVADLDSSIAAAEQKIEALGATIKELTEKKASTEASLKEHQDSRSEAKDQMAKATAMRDQEHKAFLKFKSESDTNISAIAAAVAAIEKGMGASFLQSADSNRIKVYAMEKANMQDQDRQTLLAFLSGTAQEGYAPKSGQIVGILKEMGDEMAAALGDADKAETEAKTTYEEMMKAKTKEVNTLTAQIEEEMMRLGELNVALGEDANDLEETKDTLADDQKYLAELQKGCATKEAEWDERCKVRAEEIVALRDTIKMLNSDDALELFKKTLPAPSAFLQVEEASASLRARAMALLKNAPRHSANMDLVMLALQGKSQGFEKVVKMIDDMVANLKKEQEDDDAKKEYCNTELDKSEDTKKELERSIQVSETAIEELKGAIATWTQEIADLKASIAALDRSVAEATKLRKEENTDYKQLMQDNKAAKEILLWAKNRLNKFYNPKLYKPEAASFVQIRAHRNDADAAPPPPPETYGAYSKKGQESGMVVSMIDTIVTECDKTMTEAETSEKDAQGDYEQLMADAADKRAADSKALTDKSAAKAQAEEELQAEEGNKKDLSVQLMETVQVINNLHGECDWLLKYWDVRRAARTEEVDSLIKAKAVLNGADYSLLQTRSLRGSA
jgi:predicted RNase H-like nuclease (RuvC/YqgF family)